MLDLDFSPEQEMLRQTTRDVLERHCSLDVVREMEDNPTGYPLSLWARLGELDLVGLLLPVEYGGSGMTLVEGVALYQEFGRALAPIPHFESSGCPGWPRASPSSRRPGSSRRTGTPPGASRRGPRPTATAASASAVASGTSPSPPRRIAWWS
jgi:alkylation response protein AidB-like acyl-CoA dehydrogenase